MSDEDDPYTLAVATVLRERWISTARLQRFLMIGYNRAAFYLARMEIEGIVGRVDNEQRREVLARLQ